MIRKKCDGIEWLEFELLADIPHLTHGVFLRHGGVSQGRYESLNAGGGKGDDPERVKENRKRILKVMGVENCFSSSQVHGATVVQVIKPAQEISFCDAMITDKYGFALMIQHADCQAAIMYDPVNKAIANIHCGWRGNVKNIYSAAILEMQNTFSSRPENILVGISPSLGPQKAEFMHYREEFPETFWSYQIKMNYFDLWAIARMQLEEAGILSHHIEIASICTYSHPEDFFSYRRDKIMGNHATMALLNNHT